MTEFDHRQISVEQAEFSVQRPVRVIVYNNQTDQSSIHFTHEEAAELRDMLTSYLGTTTRLHAAVTWNGQLAGEGIK